MSESAVRINTKIETKDANAQLRTLENKIVKMAEKADMATRKLEELGRAKIKTETYKEVEKQIEKSRSEMSRLQSQIENGGKPKTIEKWKAKVEELGQSIEYAKAELIDMEVDGTAFIDPTTTEEYKKTEQEIAACSREMEILKLKHDELKEKQKDVNSNSDMFLKKTTKLMARMLAFSLVSKAFFAMSNVMKDGLQDLAQYSKEYNENMSAFSSATMELKYNLASVAGPVLNTLIPAFSTLAGWINTAVEAVSMFLSVLSGKSTYTRAKKQVIDYAKGVKEADNATKGALASFDDLNVLDNDSGSGASNGAISGAGAFEEIEIDSTFFEVISAIRDLFIEILPYAIAIGAALATWKILSFLTSLLTVTSAFQLLFGLTFAISGMVLVIYSYFQMWENGVDWGTVLWYIAGIALAVSGLYVLFGPVAAGIALITGGIAGLILAIKDINAEGLTASSLVLLVISIIGILLGVMMAFGAKAMWIVAIIGIVIGIIAAAIKWTENGEEALGHLRDAFGELGEFVKCIFAGDMEGALEHLKEAGRSFGNFFISIAEGIANGFISMVNAIVDAINSINISIPEWVPIFGGNNWSPTLPHWDAHVEFQRLANGGITTGSTLANIGEAGREAVLPLENNTDWMDDLASKLASKMPAYGGPSELIMEVDGKEFARVELPYLQRENNRIGTSLRVT